MQVIANRQLHGEYGTVPPDQLFECRDEIAQQLLKAGMVRHAKPPRVEYETKVIVPEAPEVSPREPFRDVPLSHSQSAYMVAEGNPMLPAADLSQVGIVSPRGRGRRSGSRSGR